MSRSKSDRRSLARLIHVGLDRTEPVVEWIIRLCGWSAILFVTAIFFFVFREWSAGAVWQRRSGEPLPWRMPSPFHFEVGEFLTSPNWRPDSEKEATVRDPALLAGTMSVTVLSMLLAVPLGSMPRSTCPEFSGHEFVRR